ncbi:MAG: DUF1570 domain-containing protein [Planctomycetes bacterium]|nr:DUF1570 domain-containing protein [Planctomycetota bacterium]
MSRLCLALTFFLAVPLPASADPARARDLAREAQRLLFAGNPAASDAKATEAIEEEPGDPEMWMVRANLRSMGGNLAGALADTADALRLAEASPKIPTDMKAQMYYVRAAYFRMLDRYADMLPDAEKAIALVPARKWALAGRGSALIGLGDHDEGVALLKEAATEDPTVNGLLALAAFLRSDAEAVLAHAALQPAGDASSAAYWKGLALAEQGKFEDAWKVGTDWYRAYPNDSAGAFVIAWVQGTPGNPHTDVEASLKVWHFYIDGKEGHPSVLGACARTLFLAGRFAECRDLLATRGVESSFYHRFWLGAAQWKLDQLAEARGSLRQARRLNPYMKAWVAKIPGLAEFFATIDAEIAAEAKVKGGPLALAKESAVWLMTAAEIEALVRRYQFARAVAEYGKLLPGTVSPVRKAEIETRVAEIKLMAAALDKLVAAVNRKPGTLKTRVAAQELTLVKADAASFEFTIPKGTGRFPWACLDLAEFLKFAAAQTLTPEERFGLCVLQWDLGEARPAQEGLAAALKAAPALKDRVTRVVARKRGLQPPAGGFVAYKGAFVTAEEKANLEKGLVRFRGEWVPAADRENLAKGLVKVGDRWLPGEEKKLLDAGYRKHDGKWMAGEDYEALTSEWAHAIVKETAHYTIRSNAGDAFVQDLAVLVELAWTELKTFYDGREPRLPKDEKMTLHAFRTFEDYRRHCVENHAEAQLNAAGFASSNSNVVVGWNMTGNLKLFLETMVHEAAHLYYYRTATVARQPSWYMEAMATYFEGFQGSTGSWKFTFLNDSRTALARTALSGSGFIPLKDLLSGDAGTLINSDTSKALVFYSECWALNYFLTRTSDKAIAKAYREYRDAMAAGKDEPFTKYFPDLPGLEKKWRDFGSGM